MGAGSEVGRSCDLQSSIAELFTQLIRAWLLCTISTRSTPLLSMFFSSLTFTWIMWHQLLISWRRYLTYFSITRGHLDNKVIHGVELVCHADTFKGCVFMTHATKAIYKLLLSDYVKVSKVSVEDMFFDE